MLKSYTFVIQLEMQFISWASLLECEYLAIKSNYD